MAVWSNEKAGEKSCARCGSTYMVEYHHVPTKDIDSFSCSVCGVELDRWKSTRCPTFTLIVRQDVLRG